MRRIDTSAEVDCAPADPDPAEPVPFEPHPSGALLHGTKASLAPGFASNFEAGRIANHVYVTQTLDAAAWGAELALGSGVARIFVVEPTGPTEDDPDVTDKRFPGNPTRSYRTREPVRVVRELQDWTGHSAERIAARRSSIVELVRQGRAQILD